MSNDAKNEAVTDLELDQEQPLATPAEGGDAPEVPNINISDYINLSSDELFEAALAAVNENQSGKAQTLFQLLLKRDPTHAEGWGYVGSILIINRRFETAVASIKRSLRLKPDVAPHWYNLGVCLQRLNRFEEAREAFERAVELEPENATFQSNLANVYRDLGKYDLALDSLKKAELLGEEENQAKGARTVIQLMKGDLKAGFEGLETRWSIAGTTPRYPDESKWDGKADISKKTLSVWVDGGFNDMIMLSRFLPELKDKAGKLSFEVPPEAVRLYSESPLFEGVEITAFDPKNNVNPDIHVPLVSLPNILGKTETSKLGGNNAYITPPNAPRILSDNFKVGIVWNGASRRMPDPGRILPMRLVTRLVDTPNTTFYSFQRGGAEKELTASGMDLLISNTASITRDMADIAALCENLDLMIAVDSYQAHLAAAMGKKVWLLLGQTPDWRWQLKPQTSPWYSSVKLYRKNEPLHWDSLIERVRADLIRESKGASGSASGSASGNADKGKGKSKK